MDHKQLAQLVQLFIVMWLMPVVMVVWLAVQHTGIDKHTRVCYSHLADTEKAAGAIAGLSQHREDVYPSFSPHFPQQKGYVV